MKVYEGVHDLVHPPCHPQEAFLGHVPHGRGEVWGLEFLAHSEHLIEGLCGQCDKLPYARKGSTVRHTLLTPHESPLRVTYQILSTLEGVYDLANPPYTP